MGAPAVALVSIGDELLNGTSVNTNAAWLGRILASEGARVTRSVTVGDDPAGIVKAVQREAAESDAVICTGGLGPTEDDRTRNALARVVGRELRQDDSVVAWLRRRFESRGREMPASNLRQALFPEGAVVLANRLGSAPGFLAEGDDAVVVALPGPPAEMRAMSEEALLPLLRDRWAGRLAPVAHRVLRTTGVAESELADRLEEFGVQQGVALAYLPSTRGVDLHLRATDEPALEETAARVSAAVGENVYAEGGSDLVEVVAMALRERGWRLATAESCTGGLLAQRITAFAGSSDYFLGGLIAYSNEAKTALADVPAGVLEAHGAVSAEVAEALASGARARFGAEAGVGITGVAGPGGGTRDKPVGTVYVAARTPEADGVRVLRLVGDRAAIRERAAQAALDLLRRML
ncbi:MAG: competence/damage-inducible protein A [Gemmatimonadota bacterium]